MNNPDSRKETVLELHDIHKRYGRLKVLKGLSLTVEPGEVYGFLGRNGAGKSTAIRIILGVTKADEGVIRLFSGDDRDVIKNRQRIGYVAQEQNFYRWMTPESLARFVGGFYPKWSNARFTQLIKDLDLPSKQKIGTFSGGMKAKLALSLALSTGPELLILDEPTAGMDPIARREFLNLVREQAVQAGATILFSTHLIDDIEAVADRICIVENGVALYEGDLRTLSRSIKTFSTAVVADGGQTQIPEAPGLFHVLESAETRERKLVVVKYQPGRGPAVLEHFFSLGWREEQMSLEDVFVSLVSRAAEHAVLDTVQV